MTTRVRRINFFATGFFELLPDVNVASEFTDVRHVFDHIANLDPRETGDRSLYLPAGLTDALLLRIDRNDEEQVRGRLTWSRRAAYPGVELLGELSPLELPEAAGLGEVTHFIHFPQRNMLGMESNFYGPRRGSLIKYIEAKCREMVAKLELKPYIRGDVIDRLGRDVRGQPIKLFEITASLSGADAVRALSTSLSDSFRFSETVRRDAVITVSMKPLGRKRTDAIDLPFEIDDLMEFLESPERAEINRMKLSYLDENLRRAVPINLLDDQFIVSRRVLEAPGSRNIQSDSMYAAIEDALRQLPG